MAGLDRAIYGLQQRYRFPWMPGSRPGTNEWGDWIIRTHLKHQDRWPIRVRFNAGVAQAIVAGRRCSFNGHQLLIP